MEVFFTFDYEMFLGPETGSVENCLLRPTEKLMDIAKRHKVHFVFFVDVLYLLKMRELADKCPKLKEDYANVYGQLQMLQKEGHDLQLHIHPQWYYSEYDTKNEKWLLDYNHYKLDDCAVDDVEWMFNEGVSFLKSIKGDRPICYRAGGYSFPQRSELIAVIRKNGITKDSSVLMGEKADTEFQMYDYSSVNHSCTYTFSDCIKKNDVKGCFEEYPIATKTIWRYKKSIVDRFVCKKEGNSMIVYGDGQGIGALRSTRGKVDRGLGSIMEKTLIKASVDNGNATWISYIVRNMRKKKSPLIVLIGHPKNQSNYSLNKIDQLLSTSLKNDIIVTFA